jgi:hypothetical protein
MNSGIILIVFVLLGAAVSVYFVWFKDKSKTGVAAAIFNSLRPEKAKRRKEDKEKQDAWIKTVDDMTLSELNSLRSKLTRRNYLLMKTGRDMKIMEAQNELHLRQKVVDEKIKTLNG